MRRLTATTLALALGLLTAVAFASCGGGEDAKLLPGTTAAEISENLDRVKQLAGEEECVGAELAAQDVSDQIEALHGVDAALKQALQRGASRLNEVVSSCEEAPEEEVAPATPAPNEETGTEPPGQEKKKEKEDKEKPEKAQSPPQGTETTPTTTETTPAPPPETPTTPPPTESGGTGAPGGVSPSTPVGEGE